MKNQFESQPLLVGSSITLRPLIADDFELLYAAASDPLIWIQHPEPTRYQRDIFKCSYFDGALASGQALTVVNNVTGEIIGSSRYYDWDPVAREIAIGYTFIARNYWGGQTNREMKTMMLDHAFQWVKTVWFHIGKDNIRSRKAIEKLGGKFTHEASKDINGVVRDTAFYKIDIS